MTTQAPPKPQPQPQPPLTTARMIEVLLQTNGNLSLTATRLGTTEANILVSLTRDAESVNLLSSALKIKHLLFANWVASSLQGTFLSALQDLEAKDITKTYTSLVQSIQTSRLNEPSDSSTPTTNTTNILNMVSLLPPNLQAQMLETLESDEFKSLTRPTLVSIPAAQ